MLSDLSIRAKCEVMYEDLGVVIQFMKIPIFEDNNNKLNKNNSNHVIYENCLYHLLTGKKDQKDQNISVKKKGATEGARKISGTMVLC